MSHPVLEKDINDLFGQLIAQNGNTAPATQPTTEPTVPVNQPPVVPVTTAQPQVPTATVPNVEPTAQTAPVVPATPTTVDLDAVVSNWDSPEPVSSEPVVPVTAPVQTTTNDLFEVAKVLNLGEIKSKEEFVRAAQELKAKADSLGVLPDDLAKAVEIAKLGGNYLEFLNVSVIDWASQDPVVLYENYVIDRYTKDGKVDSEKVDKLLDRMDEDEKELRGLELQNQYMAIQNQQKQNIEQQARASRTQFESEVKRAVDSMDAIAGFKLSPNHKTEILKDILSGADLKHNDLRSRVEALALRKYWGKMDEYRKTQIKNATAKQMLDEATFPKLTSTTQPASPDSKSAEPLWMGYLKEIEQRNASNTMNRNLR